MPSATDRRVYEDQIPPFMTVFDLDPETMADQDTVTLVNPKFDMQPKVPGLLGGVQERSLRSALIPTDPTHKHHDSTSTQTSESADSSPTTTLSTTDSSPLSDPSPSSSPDSPINLIPLNNFPATSFGSLSNHLPPRANCLLSAPEAPRLQRPMTSPTPRRARNMKGLSIQPPFAGSTTTTASLVSEPASPSFIKPMIPSMKRKPSQLSLKTNTSDLITRTTLEVPPSPAMPPMLQRRALKHSTSSPHMLSGLMSSTFGPAGGMTFPKVLERNESGLSEVLRPMKSSMKMTFDAPPITEEESPIKTQMANRGEPEPFCENENNEDMKTPGYPDGPIAIYGDNVFLYMEPTADEAARFDVVINVAREVKNPFDVLKAAQENKCGFSQFRQSIPESPAVPDTAVSTASFATAFEYPEDFSETPTTPKATSSFKTPEYIHIPWDHNTDIAPDLMQLCDTIDSRTKEGKKVLIHCQQGASRSASLIIAYGLYMKPELTVNDAYYAAQAKSRWISPNMKLMYSLQDFQKQNATKRSGPSHRSRGRSPSRHRLTLSADAIKMDSQEPKTAPLPENDEPQQSLPAQSPNRLRVNSTPGPQAVSPGPATAPPTYTWAQELENKMPRVYREAPKEEVSMEVPKIEENLTPFKLGDLPLRPKSGHGKASATLAPTPMLGMPPKRTPSPARDLWSKPPPSPGFSSPSSFGFQTLSFPRFSEQPREEPSFNSLSNASLSNASFSNTSLSNASFSNASFNDAPVERTISIPGGYPEDDDALMSPRAETMTKNPLHSFAEVPGMRFAEPPEAPGGGLFSPRMGMFPRDPFATFGGPGMADPRSPPTKGEAPIVRSIDDLI